MTTKVAIISNLSDKSGRADSYLISHHNKQLNHLMKKRIPIKEEKREIDRYQPFSIIITDKFDSAIT